MKRKLENYHPYPKNTMPLPNPDIVLKGKIYFVHNKKKKRNFIIPCLLIN